MTGPASVRRRVVALGIDGGNPTLLRRWADAGLLPNIARLLERGVSGTSRGLSHFFVGSTWPSLYTGTSPAEHAHHSLVQIRPGSYESITMGEHGLVRRVPFWETLSDAGRRVAILDVPLSQLSPGLNGVQTVEWGSHDAVYGFRCSTRALAREIRSKFGVHPLGNSCDGAHRGAAEYADFLARLEAGVRRKTALTRAVLHKERWDFCIQVFTESHCAGHQCWHLHDAAHPGHDASIVAVTGDPLERVYRAIDAAVGEIVADLGDDTTIALFSAHGMSYWYGAQLLLPQILFKLGVTAQRPAPPAVPGMIRSAAEWSWHRLPQPLRNRIAPLRTRIAAAMSAPSKADAIPRDVDARRSRCFPVYNGLIEGGIRLNVKNREPNGVLEETEVDAFCADLERDLLAIIDERSGERLVREVVRTKDVVSGAALDALPDVLVGWSDTVPTGSRIVGAGAAAAIRAHSPRIGEVSGTNAFGRTGEHRPDGFCVFAGPGIAHGTLPGDFSIYDYAPTFTAMLGVSMPDVPGRPVEEVVSR
jgi:predicted AlkP superfamily phosphohydrolase/phosphomutase